MADPIHVMLALSAPVTDDQLHGLRALSDRLIVDQQVVQSLAELDGTLADVEVLLTSFGVPTVEQAPRLRWAQAYSAGVDGWLAKAGARINDLLVTTASGVHGPVMGEYSLMMMLSLAHLLPRLWDYQRRHAWPADRWKVLMPAELRGATLGVVGYGSVGRETARLAAALGMRVLACKRDPQQPIDGGWTWPGTGDPNGTLPEYYYALDELRHMLPQCDYVLLTLAATAATRHIIDAVALRRMKRSACLINVARGALVDEPALIEALQSGIIRGAGLDVFEQEPLPADSPLWSMPNVLLTPHIAGLTPAYHERLMLLFAENLQRYLAGQALLNSVDMDAGY
jgi:phosphoglycerate dehydrogenase-like enzyme